MPKIVVNVVEKVKKNLSTLGQAPEGSLCRELSTGDIYLRTYETATCLNYTANTIPQIPKGNETPVEILPKGTEVTLIAN